MHIISKKKLKDFWEKHADSKNALQAWYKTVEKTKYATLNELKATFPKADLVTGKVIFDIGGNKYRLITVIHFNRAKVYIRDVFDHKEYDKEKWRNG